MSTTWSEDEVRRLLRGLRRPHSLAALPLASALAAAYGMNDPTEAAKRFVRETFAGGGLVGKRLWELVVRSDFDARLPLTAVAREMGLSPRQFFRYRREAIVALQRRAQDVVGSFGTSNEVIARVASIVAQTDPAAAHAIYRIAEGGAPEDMNLVDLAVNAGTLSEEVLPRDPGLRLLALCRVARGGLIFGDPAGARRIIAFVHAAIFDSPIPQRARIAFELQWLAYIDALLCGEIARARTLGRTLPNLANEQADLLSRAYLSVAEIELRSGDAKAAREAMTAADSLALPSDARALTLLLCSRGGLALLEGNIALTDDCFSAAAIVLGKRAIDRWNTQTIIGVTRRLQDKPWDIDASATLVERLPGGTIALDDVERIAMPESTLRAFGRIALRLGWLRWNIWSGDPAEIERDLAELLDLSAAQGYPAARAIALAALTELQVRRADLRAARASVVRAWEAWSETGDRLTAIDLFVFRGAGLRDCVVGNAPLCNAVTRWARRVAPQHPLARLSDLEGRRVLKTVFASHPGSFEGARYAGTAGEDPVVAALQMFFAPRERAAAGAFINSTLVHVAATG